jgi:hypothetical protein
MALECEDHAATNAEHEFYRAFVVILEHLKNRALKAEVEVMQLRRELEVRRNQAEHADLQPWESPSKDFINAN